MLDQSFKIFVNAMLKPKNSCHSQMVSFSGEWVLQASNFLSKTLLTVPTLNWRQPFVNRSIFSCRLLHIRRALTFGECLQKCCTLSKCILTTLTLVSFKWTALTWNSSIFSFSQLSQVRHLGSDTIWQNCFIIEILVARQRVFPMTWTLYFLF